MKKMLKYIDLALFAVVLILGIVILARGEKISPLTSILAILTCFLDRLIDLIHDKNNEVDANED